MFFRPADIWSTITKLRAEISRKGQIIEDCKTLEEACRQNHPLCAEKLLSTTRKYKKKEANQKQYDDALVVASNHESYDVIKVNSVTHYHQISL